MEERYCQSCGMPMGSTNDMYGTEADGSKNEDYCQYCYDKGHFLADCSMDEMIAFCIPPMVEHNPDIKEEDARNMMNKFFPMLKRWKQA